MLYPKSCSGDGKSWNSHPLKILRLLTIAHSSPLEKMASQTQELILPRGGHGHMFPYHMTRTHLGMGCFTWNSPRSNTPDKSEWSSVELAYMPHTHRELLSPNKVSLEKLIFISLAVAGPGSSALASWNDTM